jgi:hypothetical protein
MGLVRRISRVKMKTPQNSPKEPITIAGCRMLPGVEMRKGCLPTKGRCKRGVMIYITIHNEGA